MYKTAAVKNHYIWSSTAAAVSFLNMKYDLSQRVLIHPLQEHVSGV